jgi:putative membrane protein
MTPTSNDVVDAVAGALGQGLPQLLPHFVVTLVLLAVGVRIYTAVTPFRERQLMEQGNVAAGVVLGGATLALAIPLAAMLATSGALIDIVVWGVVALLLQLLTVGVVSVVFFGHLGRKIESGNVAAALVLAAMQVAVALLNAAVMVPT